MNNIKSLLKKAYIALLFLPAHAIAGASPQCQGANAVGISDCTGGALEGRVNQIINTLFIVIGALAVIIMLVGAIRYITSTGDAKRIQAAKDTIFYALAGLILAILARAIVGFVIGSFN